MEQLNNKQVKIKNCRKVIYLFFNQTETGGGLSAKRKQFSLFFDDGRFQNIMEIQILKKIS